MSRPKKYKIIYPNLEKYMDMHGLNYYSFAEACGISRSTLHSYMTGEKKPISYAARKIVETTGMTFEEAFREDE